jgi:hypothetical protein
MNSGYVHNDGTAKNASSDTKENFLFGGLPWSGLTYSSDHRLTAKQKISTSRSLRLCDENSIFDKNELGKNGGSQ